MLPTPQILTGQDFDNFMAGVLSGICLVGLILVVFLPIFNSKRK